MSIEFKSYRESNTCIGITTDERNKQSIRKKLHGNVEIKDNTTENNIVGKNKIKENDTKIIITLILEAKIIEKMITLSMSDFIQVLQQKIFSFQRLGSNLLH